MIFAAFLIHGITPGPLLIKEHPDIFWGVIASMVIGNVLLVILNLPLIGLWVKLLEIPSRILYPLILIFCIIGAYSVNSSILDLNLMLGFGVLGYLMRKLEYEPAPLALAFVLGPMLETSLYQSLVISQGSFTVFVTRPIAATCLGLTFLFFVLNTIPFIKHRLKKLEKLEIS
jgi:putative tricarboxylic transport membrane protein